MPEGKGEMPTSPEAQKPEAQKPFQPSWIMEREDEFSGMNPSLQLRVRQIHQAPESIAGRGYLEKHYLALEEQVVEGKIPEDEAGIVLAKIVARIEELESQHTSPVSLTSLDSEYLRRAAEASEKTAQKLQEEEPEVERILIPETAGKCVKVVEDRLFGLLDKAVTEKKQTKEFADEFKAIEGFIKRISEDPRYKDSKDPLHKGIEEPNLSRHSFSRFPEGVYLREKLTLLLEAMRNLTDRVVEVENAEGSLLKLGAVKSEVALAKELQISFTNIDPVNWYVLTHLGKLFPEAGSIPETKIDIQAAWNMWKSVGERPYQKPAGGDWGLETILDKHGNLIAKEDRVITEEGITLELIYRSEAVEQMVRSAIAKEVGNGNVTTKGVRSELLAWCFLKVGLTFDMWDRKRWKIKADNGARDLVWFPYKQISRMMAERSGGGVLDTAGSYWAYEGQTDDARKFEDRLGERAKEILGILERNERKRKVFLVKGDWKAEGTIVGDFWSSTAFFEAHMEGDREETKKVKLKDKEKLEEIPWLNPKSQIEDGTYSGYFGYSLGMANAVVESFMNAGGRGWGVEEFVSQAFWRRETDLLVRLPDYCPIMITKDKELKKDERGVIVDRGNNERIQLLARTFARGIFWLGSYKAQPPRDFLGIPLPRKGLYTYDQVREILRAIKGSGFLTKEHYNGLLRDIQEYNFFKRGASPQQRR